MKRLVLLLLLLSGCILTISCKKGKNTEVQTVPDTQKFIMVDNDNKLESHTGIITNGGNAGYCFIDNSSSNDIPGSETHKGSSLSSVLSPYSKYETMYFVKLK